GGPRQRDPRRHPRAQGGRTRAAGGVRVQGHQPADQGGDRRDRVGGLRERPCARRLQPPVYRFARAARGVLAQPWRGPEVLDRALDDLRVLYTGARELPDAFWRSHGADLKSWTERGRTWYELTATEDEEWYPNQFVYLPGDEQAELQVMEVSGEQVRLRLVEDYRSGHSVWGINARNREQNFALNALMDPEIDFVTLLGTAGTGKTLLALAAGLAQVM